MKRYAFVFLLVSVVLAVGIGQIDWDYAGDAVELIVCSSHRKALDAYMESSEKLTRRVDTLQKQLDAQTSELDRERVAFEEEKDKMRDEVERRVDSERLKSKAEKSKLQDVKSKLEAENMKVRGELERVEQERVNLESEMIRLRDELVRVESERDKFEATAAQLSQKQLPVVSAVSSKEQTVSAMKQFDERYEFFREELSTATNPATWPGENGARVDLPKKLVEVGKRRFAENNFNVVVSDLIALNRSIPDQRSQK